ncbi:MAG: DUF1761 domain-containing protein [Alphaproteobacteria bacterium]
MDLGVSWAMLAAAAAGLVIGVIWYGIFAEPWMNAVGRTREELRPSVLSWVAAAAANLLIAYVLAQVLRSTGAGGWSGGLMTGFFMWMGFAVPILVMNNVFAKRPANLIVIDGGHALLNICLQGVVLASLGGGGSTYY